MTTVHKIITNTRTNIQMLQATPKDTEVKVYDESVLICEIDLSGIIIYINRRYKSLMGFNEDEIIGSPHTLVYHPDMPVGVFHAMNKIVKDKKIWRGYIKHLAKDGSYFWTLSYMQSKLDEFKNIIGYIIISKLAYDEFRKKAEEKYVALLGDEHIDDPYFMSSEDYFETQILPTISVNEYIEEAKSLQSKVT